MWTSHVQGQTEGREAAYLHGDVSDGGGGQVKVLLDQNIEFGGEVPPSTNTVNLAGEQRKDLRRERETPRDECHIFKFYSLAALDFYYFFKPQPFVCSHLFLRPVRHQRVFTLRVDVNQNQLTLLNGHQPAKRKTDLRI